MRLGRFDRWVRDMGCGAEGPPVGIAVRWGAAQDGAGGYMVAGRDTGCGAGGSGGRDTGVPWAARGVGVLQVGVKNAVSLLGRFASWMTLFLEGHRPHADVLPSRSLPRSFLQPRSAFISAFVRIPPLVRPGCENPRGKVQARDGRDGAGRSLGAGMCRAVAPGRSVRRRSSLRWTSSAQAETGGRSSHPLSLWASLQARLPAGFQDLLAKPALWSSRKRSNAIAGIAGCDHLLIS